MIIAIDFDHTICDMDHVPPHGKMGPPMPGALDAIKQLNADGHKLIVHTVRGSTMAGTKAVIDWLNYFGFPPMSVTAVKPNADVYLDDKSLKFTSWESALEALRG